MDAIFGSLIDINRLVAVPQDKWGTAGVASSTLPAMRWIVDLSYLVFLVLASPVLLPGVIRRGRHRTDWPARLGRVPMSARRTSGPSRVMLHAVSVGEVNSIRGLVPRLHASGLDIVVAVTTDTGFKRASELFGSQHCVVRYPLDLSWAVARFLRAIAPDVVALVELEVWPNFVSACVRQGTPVQIINGRLSTRSMRRYRRFRWFVRPMFRKLARVGVQDAVIAKRFCSLGVPLDRVVVDGNMKWDNADLRAGVDGSDRLLHSLGIDSNKPLVVGGSTAPDEHALLHEAVPDGCQLLCAPRRPEWFDDAAGVLVGCARRSKGECGSETDRFLLDTIGELSQAYALADIVVIGRSFGALHGSDMMEPIGLGVVTIVGPSVSDFASTVECLLEHGGIVQCQSDQLADRIEGLLADDAERHRIAQCGQAAILQMKGATERTAIAILESLGHDSTISKNKSPAR